MFRSWKLRAARRDLDAMLEYEVRRQHEMQHLREVVLPKIQQRIVAAEAALLRDRCQAALVNPHTPASHASHLMTWLIEQQSPSGRRRWWSSWRNWPRRLSAAVCQQD